ncbi:MAG: hypothetical protein AB7E60_01845 [Sphingobium sp.]
MRYLSLIALMLSACTQAPVDNAAAAPAGDSAPTTDMIERAKAKIAGEPRVRDLVLDPAAAVMLHVAVDNSGGREYGYAEYLCLELSDLGFDKSKAVVRVIDAARIEQSQGDFRSISLGTVQCADQARWD